MEAWDSRGSGEDEVICVSAWGRTALAGFSGLRARLAPRFMLLAMESRRARARQGAPQSQEAKGKLTFTVLPVLLVKGTLRLMP